MISGLRRQIRLGEFKLLLTGVLLVGIALTTVGTFSDRLERVMQDRTSALLGADGLISSTRSLDESYTKLAKNLGLEVAQSVSFMSMVITDNSSQLAGVRAVSSSYPLRGEVVLNILGRESNPQQIDTAPVPGTFWAASQFLKDLDLDGSSIAQLGDAELEFKGEILLEPEGGTGMLRLAPRVLINIADLGKTGLITPVSRARYRLLVAGTDEALSNFERAIEPKLKPHESWRIADLRRKEVRSTVGRIVSYIRLAVLLSVILSVVAMALAAQGLWSQQVNEIALLRCLGQKHGQTLKSLVRIYISAAVPASLTGAGLGYLLQAIAARFVEAAAGIQLPASSWVPGLISVLICLISLAAVMLPILVSIRSVPTLSLLRVGQTDGTLKNRMAIYSILALLVLLILFLSRDLTLAFIIIVGFVLATILLWSTIRVIIIIANRFTNPSSTPWYIAVKAVCSNGSRSAWISSSFGAIMFALVLLGVVRVDIFDAWQKSVPADAPNLFLINIKESNRIPLKNFLEDNGINDTKMYIVIRSRIAEINNQDTSRLNINTEDFQHRVNHDFNITELSELPDDNEIIDGKWFTQGEPGFSIESETATVLDLKLGDTLTMDVAGRRYTAPVQSLRNVKWDNMQPNFFIIASKGLFSDVPRNFISGIYVKERRSELVYELNKLFPNVTAIDLGMLLKRFRKLADQGSGAISMVFLFTLVSAVLVFTGILQGQRGARKLEIALLKSMGATKKFVRSAILVEFVLLGLIAGMVGSALAMLSSWLLAQNLFDFPFDVPWRWVLASVSVGAVVVSATGYISIRNLLGELPIRLLSPGFAQTDRVDAKG